MLDQALDAAEGRRADEEPRLGDDGDGGVAAAAKRGTKACRRRRSSGPPRSRGRDAPEVRGNVPRTPRDAPPGSRRPSERSRNAVPSAAQASEDRAAPATKRTDWRRRPGCARACFTFSNSASPLRNTRAPPITSLCPPRVLRRGLQRDVGAELERALDRRRRERVVDHGDSARGLRKRDRAAQVHDLEERVRRRLEADHPCRLFSARAKASRSPHVEDLETIPHRARKSAAATRKP